jgi:hypothetical protein
MRAFDCRRFVLLSLEFLHFMIETGDVSAVCPAAKGIISDHGMRWKVE